MNVKSKVDTGRNTNTAEISNNVNFIWGFT